MSHPFGDLLLQFRARKRGLSQTRLAHLAGYDPAILARMSQGKKDLTGPSGRDRVVRVVEVLHEEGVLSTLDEANGLLAAAGMPPLYAGLPVEATLIQSLSERDAPQLLTQTSLVILTGIDGVGKTWLAIEVVKIHTMSIQSLLDDASSPRPAPRHQRPA